MIAGARFFKVSGGGNDFIVLPALDGTLADFGGEQARRLCSRRLSLGADGVVLLRPSSSATAGFELYNSDGSSAAFSGNGGRCAVRVLDELGLAESGSLSLETVDGVVRAELDADRIGLEITPPRDIRPGVVLPAGAPAERGVFAIVGVPYLAVAVAVDELDGLDLLRLAPPLRRFSEFPQGANVAFFAPSKGALRLRTWERGVEGETLSSGTGCAIVALATALGDDGLAEDGLRDYELAPRSGIPASVSLDVRGGAVRRMVLSGDARLIAEGRLGADAITGFALP